MHSGNAVFLVTLPALVIKDAVVVTEAMVGSGTHWEWLAAAKRTLIVLSLVLPTQPSADSCSSAQGGVGSCLLSCGVTGCLAWG